MDYYVVPKGDKELLALLIERDSPGEIAFRELGARPEIHRGFTGLRLGDFFYTAEPTSQNGLFVIGVKSDFRIEMPVKRMSIAGGRIYFIDDFETTTLTVERETFKLEIGYVALPSNGHDKIPWSPTNGHKPSPWQ